MSLISNYLIALFLTIVIELVIAFLFGYRKKLEILTIVFVNLLTNPILNYFLFVNDHFSFFKVNLIIILFLELVVVLAEWKLLVFALREKSNKLLILSFAMNFCSYIIGFFIFK